MDNPIAEYFDFYKEGPGIWKWLHYFEYYQRHFHRFVGKPLNLLEIGVYSGGSLGMWKKYFGKQCQIYGVDIEADCKSYEDEQVKVFIGDQADRAFWKDFKTQTPQLDIVIDDGGHEPEQQLVTFQEILSHIRPGGIYFCEDIHQVSNTFATYLHQLSHNLNACHHARVNPGEPERRIVYEATEFQSRIHSIHLYPYVAVVEFNRNMVREFVCPKRGTQWQPFLGK